MTFHATTRARAVSAAGRHWPGVLGACLDQLDPLPAGANLGIVYMSEWLAPMADDILRALQERTRIARWLGACGSAVLGGPVLGGQDGQALAVLVSRLPERGFRLASSAGEIAAGCRLLLMHGELDEDAGPGLDGRWLHPPAMIVGGLAAADGYPIQIAGGVVGGEPACLGFGSEVPALAGMAAAGAPIGPAHRVTCSLGAEIQALDGRPALAVLDEEMGDLFRHARERFLGQVWLAEPGGKGEAAGWRLRRVAAVDAGRGTLRLAGGRCGRRVRLMRADPAAALARVRELGRSLRQRLGGRTAAGGLYLASRHRRPGLFGPEVDELALLRAELPGVPLIGLATDAEIFGGVVHEAAGVLVLFG